jgi:ribosome biogenesis protein ENP2
MAIGDELGKTNVYDLRNPNPIYSINHSYKLPIKKIKFHENSQNIITIDKKLAKFSNMKNGRNFTNIETRHDINDFEFYKDSGMFFVNKNLKKI